MLHSTVTAPHTQIHTAWEVRAVQEVNCPDSKDTELPEGFALYSATVSYSPHTRYLPARCVGACEGVCGRGCTSVCSEVTGFNFPSQRQFVFIAHGRSQWSYHLCHDSADGINFATSPSPNLISMHEVEEKAEAERKTKKAISLSLNKLHPLCKHSLLRSGYNDPKLNLHK